MPTESSAVRLARLWACGEIVTGAWKPLASTLPSSVISVPWPRPSEPEGETLPDDDIDASCAAESHDGDCVGLACTRTAPRE